jgi:hypothetical protein
MAIVLRSKSSSKLSKCFDAEDIYFASVGLVWFDGNEVNIMLMRT